MAAQRCRRWAARSGLVVVVTALETMRDGDRDAGRTASGRITLSRGGCRTPGLRLLGRHGRRGRARRSRPRRRRCHGDPARRRRPGLHPARGRPGRAGPRDQDLPSPERRAPAHGHPGRPRHRRRRPPRRVRQADRGLRADPGRRRHAGQLVRASRERRAGRNCRAGLLRQPSGHLQRAPAHRRLGQRCPRCRRCWTSPTGRWIERVGHQPARPPNRRTLGTSTSNRCFRNNRVISRASVPEPPSREATRSPAASGSARRW